MAEITRPIPIKEGTIEPVGINVAWITISPLINLQGSYSFLFLPTGSAAPTIDDQECFEPFEEIITISGVKPTGEIVYYDVYVLCQYGDGKVRVYK